MLTALALHHAPALAAFLADYRATPGEPFPAYFHGYEGPIEQVVARLGARARGEGLGPDEVPGSTFFWQEGGALLGVLGLRHRLNARLRAFGGHIGYSVRPGARRRGLATRMLAEAMTLARARGIAGVLLTCAPDNLASIRVIERSGGVFEAEAYFAPEDRRVRRYWIGPPEPENTVNSAP